MVATVLALILTVLMGGIIAYNGDLIGRKFGKRRVSLLGLRPKHTAILITSITGIFISGLTTGVLFMLVRPVRDVILNGEAAIRQQPVLEKQIKETEQRRLAAEANIVKARTDIARTSQELAHARGEETKALQSLNQITDKLARAQQTYQEALGNLKRAKEATITEQRKNAVLAKANVDLASGNIELAKSNGELTSKRDQLIAQVKDLTKQQTVLMKANAELAKANTELAKQNGDLSHENDEIARINTNLLREKEKLSKQNEVMTRENVRLTTENDNLMHAAREIAMLSRNQSGLFEKMRTGRIAIHGGEDLARGIFPRNTAPDVIRRRLDQLMHDASVAAREKGASASDGGGARAVEVVDKQFYAASSNGGPIPVHVTANERIEAVVNSLAWSETPVCVLALAVANSVEGEPAAIDFQPFPDRLVYPKGYAVGSRRFDAGWPADKLYNSLAAFLKDLGKTAIDRGMIPRMDPVSGEPQVGSMDIAELVEVVERIRARNRPVKLTAMAREDLNASEPLKLDFRIDNSL